MVISKFQLCQILKSKFGEQEAVDLVNCILEEIKVQLDQNTLQIDSKDDILKFGKLNKTIYLMGLIQCVAIIESVFLIFNFMFK